MKIKSLKIINYKAIRFIETDNLNNNDVLVFAGENGVGKSILFDAINYLVLKSLGQRTDPLEEIVTKGEKNFEITIEFSLNNAEKTQNKIQNDVIKVVLTGNIENNSQNITGDNGLLNSIVQRKVEEREKSVEPIPPKDEPENDASKKTKKSGKRVNKKKTDVVAGNLIYLPPHRYESPVAILKNVDDNVFNTTYEPSQRYKRSTEQTTRSTFVLNYLLDLYLKADQARKDKDGDSIHIKNYENFFQEFNSIFYKRKRFEEIRYAGDSDNRGYKFMIKDLLSGELIELKDLSSGEKEVLFMLTYLKTQNPNGCIVCIDEPELHIHHKLQSRMLRSIKRLGKGNQVLLMTHSIEIVREANKMKGGVYELRRFDSRTKKSQLEECKARKQWLSLFKHLTNGLEELLLTDVIIFVEGNKSKNHEDLQSDAEIYGYIFDDKRLHFIPSGDAKGVLKATKETFKIIQRGIAFKKIFGIRDGDGLSDKRKQEIIKDYSNRLRILRRYSIENYFLDYDVLGKYLQLPAEDYFDALKAMCEDKKAVLVDKIQGSRKENENDNPNIAKTAIKRELKPCIERNSFDIVPGKVIIGSFLNKHGQGYKKNWNSRTKKELCRLLKRNIPEELEEIKKSFLLRD